jgi:hypothetical protein
MRVYKKKYITKGFTPGKEWMTKDKKGRIAEYIGPIVFYAGNPFGGESMTKEVQKNMRLYPFQTSKNNILYDEIKPEYNRNFREPVPYKHKLTEKEIEKGEYTRYFTEVQNTGAICEVDKEQYKYFKKDSTPYHKNLLWVEIKLKISTKAVGLNYEAILEAKQTIKNIHKFVLPTDYMNWPANPKGVSTSPDGRRIYEGGEMLVPTNLPAAFQIGNLGTEQVNALVPPNQNCANCFFYENGVCEKFDAEVRDNYWCAKYIYDVNDDPYYRPKIKLPK